MLSWRLRSSSEPKENTALITQKARTLRRTPPSVTAKVPVFFYRYTIQFYTPLIISFSSRATFTKTVFSCATDYFWLCRPAIYFCSQAISLWQLWALRLLSSFRGLGAPPFLHTFLSSSSQPLVWWPHWCDMPLSGKLDGIIGVGYDIMLITLADNACLCYVRIVYIIWNFTI